MQITKTATLPDVFVPPSSDDALVLETEFVLVADAPQDSRSVRGTNGWVRQPLVLLHTNSKLDFRQR
jgi:hypothetical protein